MPKRRLTIRLDEENYEALTKFAQSEGVTVNALMESLVEFTVRFWRELTDVHLDVHERRHIILSRARQIDTDRRRRSTPTISLLDVC